MGPESDDLDGVDDTTAPQDTPGRYMRSGSDVYGVRNGAERSSVSLLSTNTVVDTGIVMNLPHERLCTFIDAHRSMHGAEIVRSCTFVEKKHAAPHRCILLELHRPGRKNIWVRLERKPRSGAALVSGKGRTPSNDVVNTPMRDLVSTTNNLSLFKCSLATDDIALIDIEKYKLDNAQVFDSRPSLGDLRPFLGVMQETLTEYTVWSVSCSLWLKDLNILIKRGCIIIEKLLDVLFLYSKIPPTDWRRQMGSWTRTS